MPVYGQTDEQTDGLRRNIMRQFCQHEHIKLMLCLRVIMYKELREQELTSIGLGAYKEQT